MNTLVLLIFKSRSSLKEIPKEAVVILQHSTTNPLAYGLNCQIAWLLLMLFQGSLFLNVELFHTFYDGLNMIPRSK